MVDKDKYDNFQNYCADRVRKGDSYASRFLKDSKNSLTLALEEAKRQNLSQDLINKVEEKGMLDGSFKLTYEGAERIYRKVKELVKKEKEQLNKDYLGVLENFDPIRDSDLIATGIFCLVPEVRERVNKNLESLYKVVLNVGMNRKKGYLLPEHQKLKPVSRKNFFPSNLRNLLINLPKIESSEDEKYQRMLKVLIQKKAEREVFPFFKHGEAAALSTLEELAINEKNEDIRVAYKTLADTYRGYLDFQLKDVNPDFVDPETNEKGVLPSLHQKIGVYHSLKEERFGIWDGGGTGKTAIGILLKPLIEEKMKKRGKEFKRVIVVCPNEAKKAWKKGLIGNDKERYLREKQDAIIINNNKKDKKFIKELKNKEWIVTNYDQLITKINGSNKLFINVLIEQGVDYVIFDESHKVKSLRETTNKGKPTHSAAARMLALNAEYFVPMSATPISNGLNDFAIQYHLLNPSICPNPEKFMELIQNSPRILYTFFNEKSVRRTAEDINENLDWSEIEHEIELDPIQRKIYDHIIEFRPSSWLPQARKALLDPRLVDPEILKRAGVLGDVSYKNSSKYKKLEELLTASDGPVARKDKFVIFSTMLREGVTEKGHEKLQKRYKEMGISSEYEKLEFDKSLDIILQEVLKRKYKKDLNIGVIDGTIKVEEREKIVDGLKNGLDGILCTTNTGGQSLDFSGANHEYFLDESYVPDTEEQAIWRELRKGQKKKVFINHLRTKDTLDEPNKDYVNRKRIISKTAMDGVPPTEEEWNLLEDTEGKRFGELIKRGLGGKSIDVTDADINDIIDFETKKRIKKSGGSFSNGNFDYNTTDAQEIMKWIGKDPDCWNDPKFVELYMKTLNNLAVPVIHRAKICNLVQRASNKEINFPKKVLSEGAGPSLLYNAYQNLNEIIKQYNFSLPVIVDRDTSKLMLEHGKNPNKMFGCMTGKNSMFKDKTFDMVDNESISLLNSPEEVKSSLLEASRILKQDGLIELIVKNMRFMKGFYSGMEKLGFQVLSNKNEGFFVGKEFFNRLKNEKGEHFVQSYANKLSNTHLIFARKKDNPAEVSAENFWFEKGSPEAVNTNQSKKEREKIPEVLEEQKFTPKIKYQVDKNGIVQSVRKIK
ncbi:hypothetical protein CMI39_03125 [Candidatus Pacearchaeota archaeon]|mgnify:CR=1 FL=1|jgi:SNF2 family DNA or RNA helicase|nr:hypothetical protein [Candidatus Pacearchaeota archaeon]|tara:strand:+ start:5313 stop:8654 length:3342 start_codon:yes stop_codon:yes gene_type:complete